MIHRQGHLIPESGTYDLTLYGNDWRIVPGHRIGVLISTAHAEWWLGAVPTNQTVSVTKATLELPFLRYTRPDHISGKSAVRLENYLANTPIQLSRRDDRERDRQLVPSAARDGGAARGRQRDGQGQEAARLLKARLSQGKSGKRVFLHGRAPKGSRLKVRLFHRGELVARSASRPEAASLGGHFRAQKAGRYRAVVKARKGDRKMRKRTKVVRVRGYARAGAYGDRYRARRRARRAPA